MSRESGRVILKVGDRVYHRSLQQYGTIATPRDGCIVVEYDSGNLTGKYDQSWFEIHPDMLVRTDRAAAHG